MKKCSTLLHAFCQLPLRPPAAPTFEPNRRAHPASCWFCMMRESNWNLSGNEVYHTAYSLLVILKNVCSKLHWQKDSNFILFSHKTGEQAAMCFTRVTGAPPRKHTVSFADRSVHLLGNNSEMLDTHEPWTLNMWASGNAGQRREEPDCAPQGPRLRSGLIWKGNEIKTVLAMKFTTQHVLHW